MRVNSVLCKTAAFTLSLLLFGSRRLFDIYDTISPHNEPE